jgi:cyclopropane-fatty-acyl-phospholipid synthase
MPDSTALAVNWVEQGLVPDKVVRLGIRRLLKARLIEMRHRDSEWTAELTQAFIAQLRSDPLAPLALAPHKANEQHYEVSAAFFETVLGIHRKYSSCFWGDGVHTLAHAEAAALQASCERAGLVDGQQLLELGCGWGSLTLWIAEHFRASRITALSNSNSQREYIQAQAAQRGLTNVQVLTCDINEFDTAARFDRVVSIEMFEHLRNWPQAFARVARWLEPQGQFFMHVFAHRGAPYAFVERDASDWMSKHFFSGGMMPSDELALHFQDELRLLAHWRWDGTHYERTAQAWLANMDENRDVLWPILESTYGQAASTWWMRWRLFFMSVAELFGYDDGQQWGVSQYLFDKRA